MESLDSLKALQRTNEELRMLVDLGRVLAASLDLDEILRLAMEKVGALLRSPTWSLLLVDEHSGDLVFEVAVSPVAERLRGLRLKKGEGIAGWVATRGEPLMIGDASKDPRFLSRVDDEVSFTTRSVLCVPLRDRDRILGVIELVNSDRENAFGPEDLEILGTVADFVAIAIQNARYVSRIADLAVTDDLTGLYNSRHLHRLLTEETERAARFEKPLSVVFFDLDHFKEVNDTFGHLVGSGLLAEIGARLRQRLRRIDRAVRYGGDEFVLILPGTGRAGAGHVAEELRRSFRDSPFRVPEGPSLTVQASFGIAVYPDDARGPDELLRIADTRMYAVKTSTRDGVCLDG